MKRHDVGEQRFNDDLTARSNEDALGIIPQTEQSGDDATWGSQETHDKSESIAGEIHTDERDPVAAHSSGDTISSSESYDTDEQNERIVVGDRLDERERLLAELSLPLGTKTPSRDTTSQQSNEAGETTAADSSSTKSPPREILGSMDDPSPNKEPVSRVNFNFHSIVAGKAIYTGLEDETSSPADAVDGTDKANVVKELFTDKKESQDVAEAESEIGNAAERQRDVDAESSSTIDADYPVFKFGSADINTLSFTSLASESCGFASKNSKSKGFSGSGQQLFSTTTNDENGDDDDPEREVAGTMFKPVVSLPDIIEQRTGEEEEAVVYTHRAKLYRYDSATKQWKERGVGDIKILRHNATKRCRVVMRREQIHKLCANHYITSDMELKENTASDRSWLWSVDADFAEGERKSELLAVKFRLGEDAEMFREKFIECQGKLRDPAEAEKVDMKISAGEVSCVDETPSGDSGDDVEIIFEKAPTPQQKERARRYELPETFYCLEQDLDSEETPSGDSGDDVEIIFEKVPTPQQKERAQRYELPETFYCLEQDLDSEETPSGDSEDDVEIIFEKAPTPQQKERARRHELPETFYCLEQDFDSGDESEKSCDENDKDGADVALPSKER